MLASESVDDCVGGNPGGGFTRLEFLLMRNCATCFAVGTSPNTSCEGPGGGSATLRVFFGGGAGTGAARLSFCFGGGDSGRVILGFFGGADGGLLAMLGFFSGGAGGDSALLAIAGGGSGGDPALLYGSGFCAQLLPCGNVPSVV